MGVWFDELVPFVGKPGVVELERTIVALEREREALSRTLERWPTEDTKHPYRYTGREDKASFDGRLLQPGDVVELLFRQARAWADRFEAVEPEPATTA